MRKSVTVVISEEGRDQGKNFLLTEMSAMAAEKWAIKALLALSKSGVPVPDDIVAMGMAGLIAVGVRSLSGLAFADAEPLLDEMLACVKIVPNPNQPSVTRPLIPDDIEELTTLYTLRRELFSLHINFSLPAVASKSRTTAAATGGKD